MSNDVINFFSKTNVETIKLTGNLKKLAAQSGVNNKYALEFAKGIKSGAIQLKDGQSELQAYQAY